MARKIVELVTQLLNGLVKSKRATPAGTSPRRTKPTGPSPVQPTGKPSGKPGGKPAPTTNSTTHQTPSRDAKFDGVVVEYSPTLDGDPDPGEVVWTWVPWQEDPTQGKDRPVVIFGRHGTQLVGVPLTSKLHDNEPQVLVGTGSWDRDGRPSYAKLDRVLDIDPDQVRREGAVLDKARFEDLVAALRRTHRARQ